MDFGLEDPFLDGQGFSVQWLGIGQPALDKVDLGQGREARRDFESFRTDDLFPDLSSPFYQQLGFGITAFVYIQGR